DPQQGDPRDRDRLRDDQRGRRVPRHRPDARDVQAQADPAGRRRRRRRRRRRGGPREMIVGTFFQGANFIDVLYIVAFGLFIYGLSGLTGPSAAVRGDRVAAVGMAVAVIATLLNPDAGNWGLIVLGVAIGTPVGIPAARSVKMTAMPPIVALFNGVGGGAVALVAWAEFRNTGGYAHAAVSRLAHPGTQLPIAAGSVPLYFAAFSLFAAIVGSVSFWGSNIAVAKLQGLPPGQPATLR